MKVFKMLLLVLLIALMGTYAMADGSFQHYEGPVDNSNGAVLGFQYTAVPVPDDSEEIAKSEYHYLEFVSEPKGFNLSLEDLQDDYVLELQSYSSKDKEWERIDLWEEGSRSFNVENYGDLRKYFIKKDKSVYFFPIRLLAKPGKEVASINAFCEQFNLESSYNYEEDVMIWERVVVWTMQNLVPEKDINFIVSNDGDVPEALLLAEANAENEEAEDGDDPAAAAGDSVDPDDEHVEVVDPDTDADEADALKAESSEEDSQTDPAAETPDEVEEQPAPDPEVKIELGALSQTLKKQTEEAAELDFGKGEYRLKIKPTEGFEVSSVTARGATQETPESIPVTLVTETNEETGATETFYGPIEITDAGMIVGGSSTAIKDDLDVEVTLGEGETAAQFRFTVRPDFEWPPEVPQVTIDIDGEGAADPQSKLLANAEEKPVFALGEGEYRLSVTPNEGFALDSVKARDIAVKQQTEGDETYYGPIKIDRSGITVPGEDGSAEPVKEDLDVVVTLSKEGQATSFSFTIQAELPELPPQLTIAISGEGVEPQTKTLENAEEKAEFELDEEGEYRLSAAANEGYAVESIKVKDISVSKVTEGDATYYGPIKIDRSGITVPGEDGSGEPVQEDVEVVATLRKEGQDQTQEFAFIIRANLPELPPPQVTIDIHSVTEGGRTESKTLENPEDQPAFELSRGVYRLNVAPIEGYEIKSVKAVDASLENPEEISLMVETEGDKAFYGPIDIAEAEMKVHGEDGTDHTIQGDLRVTVSLGAGESTADFSFTVRRRQPSIQLVELKPISDNLARIDADEGQDIHNRANRFDLFGGGSVSFEVTVEANNGFGGYSVNDGEVQAADAQKKAEEGETEAENAEQGEENGETQTENAEQGKENDETQTENAEQGTADGETKNESAEPDAENSKLYTAIIELEVDPAQPEQQLKLTVFDTENAAGDPEDADSVTITLRSVGAITVDEASASLVINAMTEDLDLVAKGTRQEGYDVRIKAKLGEEERLFQPEQSGESWTLDLSGALADMKALSPGEVRFEAGYYKADSDRTLGEPTRWSWTVDCEQPEVTDVYPEPGENLRQANSRPGYFKTYNVFPDAEADVALIVAASEPVGKVYVNDAECAFEAVSEAGDTVRIAIPFEAGGGEVYPKIQVEDVNGNLNKGEIDIVLHPVTGIAVTDIPGEDEVLNLAAFAKGVTVKGSKDREYGLAAYLKSEDEVRTLAVDAQDAKWSVTLGAEEAQWLREGTVELTLMYEGTESGSVRRTLSVDCVAPDVRIAAINGMPVAEGEDARETLLPGETARIELGSDAQDVAEYRLYEGNSAGGKAVDAETEISYPGEYRFSAVDIHGNEGDARATLVVERGQVRELRVNPTEITLSPKLNTAEIVGTAQPNEALNMGVTADAEGNWSYTIGVKDLNDGAPEDGHKYEVKFEYANPALEMNAAAVSVTWDESCELSVRGPVFEGETIIDGTVEPGAGVTVNGDAAEVDENGGFSYTLERPLRSGDIYSVEAVDACGNQAIYTVTVEASEGGPDESQQLTLNEASAKDGTITVSGAAKDAYSRVAVTFTNVADGAEEEEVVDIEDGGFTVSHPAEDGEYTISARYADYFEGYSSAATQKVTVDTEPPVIERPEAIDDKTERLEFSVNEALSGFSASLDGEEVEVEKDDDLYAVSFAPNSLLDVKAVKLTAKDRFGNEAEAVVEVTHDENDELLLSFEEPDPDEELDCEGTAVFVVSVKSRRSDTAAPELMITDAKNRMVSPKLEPIDDPSAEADAWYSSAAAYRAEVDLKELAVGDLTCKLSIGSRQVTRTFRSEKKKLRLAIIATAATGALFLAMLALFIVSSRKYKRNRDAQIDKRSGSSRLTIRKEKVDGRR